VLKHAPILIVEAGGKVVGPVGSVSAALALLQTCTIAAVVLDVQLSDRDVTHVAARSVPLIFQSARRRGKCWRGWVD
jgi:hypothetical protein